MTAVVDASTLSEWRGKAITIPRPTKRDEAWRYAPLSELAALEFGDAAAVAIPEDVDAQIPALDGPTIVIVNGAVDTGRSTLGAATNGLSLSSLAEALDANASQISLHYAPKLGADPDAFKALNSAFATDGAVVQVAPGTHLEAPIHVVNISLPEADNASTASGIVIEVGAGSQATVVETRIGAGAAGASSVRTTVSLGAEATLDHVILQDAPANQVHLCQVEATQGAGSVLNSRSFNLGASYGRIDYAVSLVGEGAHADLVGLYFGLGAQTLDQQINVVHAAPNCTSRQSFRGVLDDESTGVFNGGIDVRPGADGTDAEQANDNLLLSMRAEINTQPRLEILADEVACKHGATVGQLDDTALYYMRSRGIPADEARRLLVNGFADQQVDELSIESLRGWVIDRLGHADA